jgi:hypothetical protein
LPIKLRLITQFKFKLPFFVLMFLERVNFSSFKIGKFGNLKKSISHSSSLNSEENLRRQETGSNLLSFTIEFSTSKRLI